MLNYKTVLFKMRKFLFLALVLCWGIQLKAQRKEITIPNISGLVTLKCDFHMHTIFSDGDVWPTIRVEEAWLDGLDAIAITEHIEYQPHSGDISADHNRAYELAAPVAKSKNIILVRGAEITRHMPPGHINALFIKNANLLKRENVIDALKEAKEQNAFLVWNHPGWKAQQPDSTHWFDMHTQLLDNGMMHGIEVCNAKEYYPEALVWAKEKNLTILATSDIHKPIDMVYRNMKRPITLVFAKERTQQAIREAMENRRSVAYANGKIMGDEKWLAPLFYESIEVTNLPITLKNSKAIEIHIHNKSELDLHLKASKPGIGVGYPDEVVLKAFETTSIVVVGNSEEIGKKKTFSLDYNVTNMLVQPTQPLNVKINIPNSI